MSRRSGKPAPTWLVLAGWALVVGSLGLLGGGIAARLSPASLLVPGTPSARAHAMLDRQFGNSVPVTVLLQGPARAIDRQGPRLVAALRREGGVQVMSPWDSGGAQRSLRPRPSAALIVAGFQRPESEGMSKVVPTAQRVVDENVRPPLRAQVGGVAAIAAAIQKDALAATQDAELLVAPILVIVLLLVFRSPVAAAVPLLMGAATVFAGRGLLLLSTYVIPINSLAVAIASMMGLALGVDYALLMVSRFRQERDGGADTDAAIATSAHAAGRTIVFAGGTLALAMLTAAFVAPGDLLGSVAAGVVVSALLSVGLAISLLPTLLGALSPYLERWRLPSVGRGDRLLGLAAGLIARPWIAIPLIVAPMLAIAAPASALRLGPPDPGQLPPSDPTRQGFEALRRAIGPGWAAPIAVLATARDGVISDSGRLAAISRWQNRVAREPGVAAVIGPASLQEAEGPLHTARRAYGSAPAKLTKAQRGIASLRSGLRHASEGVAELRAGLGASASGAATIGARTSEARAGAGRLETGLGRASAGAQRLSAGLGHALGGADALLRGQRRLSAGAARLARGVRSLDESLRGPLAKLQAVSARLAVWADWIRSLRVPTEMAAQRLEHAVQELNRMTVGRRDPRYAKLLEAVREASALVGAPAGDAPARGETVLPAGVTRSLAATIVGIQEQLAGSVESLAALPDRLRQLADGAGRLRTGANQVASGARASERGGRQLRAALGRLARGAHRLDHSLGSARDGSGRLADGLGTIATGAGSLAAGMRDGEARSGQLAGGLARPEGPLSRYAVLLHGYRRGYDTLRSRSPGAIDSGYLMLTALDGTVPATREQIAQVVNLNAGGQTVRMLIVPSAGASAPATVRLSHRLQGQLPALARASGTEVAIGEGAQSLADYTDATMARIPWLALALSLVAVAMLILVVRSLLLPLVAVALNLLTIAAAFGALKLFFGLDLLVGPPLHRRDFGRRGAHDHVRPLDRLRGLPAHPHAGGLAGERKSRLRDRVRPTQHRGRDRRRGNDHELGLPRLRHRRNRLAAAVRRRAHRRGGARRDRDPAGAFAGDHAGPGAPGLVDSRWLDRLLPVLDHGGGPAPAPTKKLAVKSAIREFEVLSHAEHSCMLDLLAELEQASATRDAGRLVRLVRELRAIAEPHFHYEQTALFPRLAGALGPERIESLHAEQDDVVAALQRIEALALPGRIYESGAAEARRLARAARASVEACDAACEAVESQPEEVAARVLAARELVLADAGWRPATESA